MRSTRILNVLHDERVGGPQSRVIQVARLPEEAQDGADRRHACGRSGYASMLLTRGVETYEFDLVRLRRSLDPRVHAQYVRRFWPNPRTLRRLIRDTAVDVVHVYGLMHLQGPLAARLERVPLVSHRNDVGTPPTLRRVLLPLLRRWATVVAVSTQGVADYYFDGRAPGDDGLAVLYSAVDYEKFNPSVSGEAVRSEFGLAPDTPGIGTIANLSPGYSDSYPCPTGDKNFHPRVKLLVVGESLQTRRRYWQALGQLTDTLEHRENVISTGRRADVPAVLGAMDVSVHPALAEPAGMATMESRASGLPVVVSRVGGAAEIVGEGRTEILVKPASPGAIASAVSQRMLPYRTPLRRWGSKALFACVSCSLSRVQVKTSIVNGRQVRDAGFHRWS